MKAKSFLLMLVAATGIAVAQTDTKNKVEREINELIETQDAAVAKFIKEVRALPREKQREAYQNGYPDSTDTTNALSAIVKKHPADSATLKAISWIARKSRGQAMTPDIYSELEKHHLDHEGLSDIVLSLYSARNDDAIAFLSTVAEKSKNKDVRGTSLYLQAMKIERDSKKAEEYKKLVEKINAEHADLEIRGRKVAEVMKATLEAKEKLAIGKVAPEIIGKDVDGNPMKLSDYKGKIVVLDFWGDW